MKILIVVPGYGNTKGNINHKKNILDNNLDFILSGSSNLFNERKIIIKQFNAFDKIYSNPKYNNNIQVVLRNISISQFLYEYINIDFTKNFDYILLLLDDVEILQNQSVKFEEIINLYEKLGIDILSPAVIDSSHPYMNPTDPKNKVRKYKSLEFYCYLMKYESYVKYFQRILVPWNSYLWGCDLVLYQAGIKTGIYDNWITKHHYRSSYNLQNEHKNMNKYLNYFFNITPYNAWNDNGKLLEIIKL